MKILERLALLLRADAHGVMDQLEERSLLMKQNLRDAELELARKRTELHHLEEEERSLQDELLRVDKQARALDEDVALALQGGNDELARYSIRRLLPQRETIQGLEARIDTVRGLRGRLAETLALQQESFSALKLRVRDDLAMRRRESAASESRGEEARSIADEAVELEMLRRREGAVSGAGSC